VLSVKYPNKTQIVISVEVLSERRKP